MNLRQWVLSLYTSGPKKSSQPQQVLALMTTWQQAGGSGVRGREAAGGGEEGKDQDGRVGVGKPLLEVGGGDEQLQ
jgi:hypothetical protein